MAKNTLSKNPCLNCPYVFLNETSNQYVFNLSSFAADCLNVSISKEIAPSFKAFALDFIQAHGLERVTFSNARGLIFVKFDCPVFEGTNYYDFRPFVELALLAGLNVFDITFNHNDFKQLQKHVTSILYNGNELSFHAADKYDVLIFEVLYTSKVKAISYACSIQAEPVNKEAPALMPAIGTNPSDDCLLVNLTAYYEHVALALNAVINHDNKPCNSTKLTKEALFKALNYGSLLEGWLDCSNGPFSKRDVYHLNGDVFIYRSFEVVKQLVLDATRAACVDAIANNISPECIQESAPKFVKDITSILFTKEQQGSKAYEVVFNTALNSFKFTLVRESYYNAQMSLEDEFLSLPARVQSMPFYSF